MDMQITLGKFKDYMKEVLTAQGIETTGFEVYVMGDGLAVKGKTTNDNAFKLSGKDVTALIKADCGEVPAGFAVDVPIEEESIDDNNGRITSPDARIHIKNMPVTLFAKFNR